MAKVYGMPLYFMVCTMYRQCTIILYIYHWHYYTNDGAGIGWNDCSVIANNKVNAIYPQSSIIHMFSIRFGSIFGSVYSARFWCRSLNLSILKFSSILTPRCIRVFCCIFCSVACKFSRRFGGGRQFSARKNKFNHGFCKCMIEQVLMRMDQETIKQKESTEMKNTWKFEFIFFSCSCTFSPHRKSVQRTYFTEGASEML